jgi:hypothetical protein
MNAASDAAARVFSADPTKTNDTELRLGGYPNTYVVQLACLKQ